MNIKTQLVQLLTYPHSIRRLLMLRWNQGHEIDHCMSGCALRVTLAERRVNGRQSWLHSREVVRERLGKRQDREEDLALVAGPETISWNKTAVLDVPRNLSCQRDREVAQNCQDLRTCS